ncbi:MAG: hypothetical protein AUJ86_05470 [Hydrogenophilaceae bacterium CG1_02_62_390]|nr:MAG: hypothetical protein AUJ86_05470 [Hydrogenophilaceae bacterium CG1_02_62_390]
MLLGLPPVLAAEVAPDANATLAQQCRQAYRQENQMFVLDNCPEAAWALARAQCERQANSIAPRYVEFCRRFYTGTAPIYGN